MPRPIRYIPFGFLVEVTCRMLQARHLLGPNLKLNEIILGVLARAQQATGMRIHAFVFLSNHFHLIVSPTDARQLADFMCYLNSNLAREVGRFYNWHEKLFGHRYHSILVSGEEAAQIGRLRYILSHGCKEGFVARPGDWPGVHCVHALLEGRPLAGTWFNRTKENHDKRAGRPFGKRQYTTPCTVELSPLPCWEGLSANERQARIAELVSEVEQEARTRRRESGRRPLAAAGIRPMNPHDKPARSKRSPAPRVHAATRAVRLMLIAAYREFLAAYRAAADRLASGDLAVQFPYGSFPRPQPFVPTPG